MSLHAGIEALDFSYDGQRAVAPFAPVLVGVVGSGNLEVLLEPDTPPQCHIHVETSARGFGPIWSAVLADFHARHVLAGVKVSIHDMGATPAVVSLRLDQAVAELPNASSPGGRP
jgi:malonate decarboxylase delta subunit